MGLVCRLERLENQPCEGRLIHKQPPSIEFTALIYRLPILREAAMCLGPSVVESSGPLLVWVILMRGSTAQVFLSANHDSLKTLPEKDKRRGNGGKGAGCRSCFNEARGILYYLMYHCIIMYYLMYHCQDLTWRLISVKFWGKNTVQ